MKSNMAVNGSFSKPTKHFTQISNQILRDNHLSLRAKGLFSLIASYITLPNFTLYKKYIQAQCSEGRCAFDSAWKELQETGYLTHQRVRGEGGTFSYEYSLSMVDEKSAALPTPKNKFYIDATDQKNGDTEAESHISVAVNHPPARQQGTPWEERPKKRDTRFPKPAQKVSESSVMLVKPTAEHQTPVLLYSNNKTLSNNTQSVKQTRRKMEQQVEWNYFKQDSSFSEPLLQSIDLLIDYLVEEKEKSESDQSFLSAQQIEEIDSCIICEFLSHMGERAPKKIKYPKAYWTTSFGNYIKEKNISLCLV